MGSGLRGPGAAPSGLAAGDRRGRRGSGRPHPRRERQAPGRRPLGGPRRPRAPAIRHRQRGARSRASGRSLRGRRGRVGGVPAVRRRRRHRSLELPAGDPGRHRGARHRGRQRGRAQAQPAHARSGGVAGTGLAAGRSRPAGRLAEPRRFRGHRAGAHRGGGGQGRVHRQCPLGTGGGRTVRPDPDPDAAGARGQGRCDRGRGRRSRRGRRPHRLGSPPEHRVRLHQPGSGLCRGVRPRRLRRPGHCSGPTGPGGQRRGCADRPHTADQPDPGCPAPHRGRHRQGRDGSRRWSRGRGGRKPLRRAHHPRRCDSGRPRGDGGDLRPDARRGQGRRHGRSRRARQRRPVRTGQRGLQPRQRSGDRPSSPRRNDQCQ